MQKRRFYLNVLLTFLLITIYSLGFAEQQEPLYYGGPWKGRVIDAETKLPIEGAVVAAIWYREYDTRFTTPTYVHKAKEVLTGKEGYFEIPAYMETGEGKENWRKPEFYISGPIIRDPQFIIYKPGYNPFPNAVELVIYATKPFYIEYPEFYKAIVSGEKVTLSRKKSKSFPEGLVYSGIGCFKVMKKFWEKADFKTSSVFVQMDNAIERIKRLDVPLDCPKKQSEPLPDFVPGHKYELKNPLKKGGYVLVELSRATDEKEGLNIVPEEPWRVEPEKLPILFRYIKEGRELQRSQKGKEK